MVAVVRSTRGHAECLQCGAAFSQVFTIDRPAAKRPVLLPLQARPARGTGGQAAAVALIVLLLVAGGTLIVIAHPWDAGLIAPGVDGTGSQAVQGRFPGSRPAAAVPGPDGLYHQLYSFKYGGRTWDFTINVPKAAYQGFHNADRPTRIIEKDGVLEQQMAYDIFVTTPLDDAYMKNLADQLRSAAQENGWSDDETLSFALAFVQSLPYTSDKVTTGFDEYPRYPLETLVDNGGDCEDSAILYASLVQALGYGAVLLSPTGHMAVGVKANADVTGTSYPHEGAQYLYAETTGAGWAIGDVPPEYAGKAVQVFDLIPKPLFSLQVTYDPHIVGGTQQVTLNATAIGSAPAGAVQLVADLTSGTQSYDVKSCRLAVVAPGEFAICKFILDLRKVPRGQEVEIVSKVSDANYWYARAESKPWIPCTRGC